MMRCPSKSQLLSRRALAFLTLSMPLLATATLLGCPPSGADEAAAPGPESVANAQGQPSLPQSSPLTETPDASQTDSGSPVSAARGDYLVNSVLFCGNCHTSATDAGAPDPTHFLAGGKAFSVTNSDGTPAKVYAANLTPAKTGLATWTVDQIKQALTKGIDDQGQQLSNVMPYPILANLTDDDATSIALYLQSVPPVENEVSESTAMPTFVPPLDSTGIPHLAVTDPSFASAARGRYLAQLACLDCHTVRRTDVPLPDLNNAFAGGRAFGPTVRSSNLTPDGTGLGEFSKADIVETVKMNTDHVTGAKLCPPMAGGPKGFGRMTDGDLSDLATYLVNIAPVRNGPFRANGACP
jgi:mono/diheme cytochrome c family protein